MLLFGANSPGPGPYINDLKLKIRASKVIGSLLDHVQKKVFVLLLGLAFLIWNFPLGPSLFVEVKSCDYMHSH